MRDEVKKERSLLSFIPHPSALIPFLSLVTHHCFLYSTGLD